MTVPFETVDELVGWLESLPLVERYRVADLLVAQDTTKAVARVRKGVVYELTRGRTYADVAGELGMSIAAVNKAVTEHRKAAA